MTIGVEKDNKPIVNKEKKFAAIAKLEAGMTVQAGAGEVGFLYHLYSGTFSYLL